MSRIKPMWKVPYLNKLLKPVFALGLAILFYALVLITPISTQITYAVRFAEFFVAIVLVLLLYPSFKRSGWLGELWSLILTMILFAMALSWVWSSGFLDGNLIGGLLPWSDANGYFFDAQRLLIGERFSTFSSRRPLFPGLLSVLLGLTGRNLQLSLGIMGALTALACYFSAREIRRTEGPLVGVMLLVIEYLYYRVFIGKVLTENLGLALGALGLALLWRGVRESRRLRLLSGIFVLTLALIARAGAFTVLPMLVLWGTWYYRDRKFFSPWFLAGSTAAILSAFLLNGVVLRVVGSPQGMAFANFAQSFYGLASGYKSWTQAHVDHPNASDLEVYRYALDLVRSNPNGLWTGIQRAYQDFFDPKSWNAFHFLHYWGASSVRVYRLMFWISGLGVLWCFLRIKEWTGSILLATMAGILLSVPFLPPVDSDSMRVYAATIPFTGLLLGIGIAAPFYWLKHTDPQPIVEKDRLGFILDPYTILIVATCILGPIIVKTFGRFPRVTPSTVSCAPGSELVTVYVSHGSEINLVRNSSFRQSSVPNIRMKDYRSNISRSSNPSFVGELVEIPSGMSILVSINYQDINKTGMGNIWLIVDTAQLPTNAGLASFCASSTKNEWLSNYNFYYVDTPQITQASSYEPQEMGARRANLLNLFLVFLVCGMILESIYSVFHPHRPTE